MSYFSAATQGHNLKLTQQRRLENLFRKADTAWVVLTDQGYEVYVLGELQVLSFSLEEAVSELELAVLGSFRQGLPKALMVMDVGDGVWGVDMADMVRSTQAMLESL